MNLLDQKLYSEWDKVYDALQYIWISSIVLNESYDKIKVRMKEIDKTRTRFATETVVCCHILGIQKYLKDFEFCQYMKAISNAKYIKQGKEYIVKALQML